MADDNIDDLLVNMDDLELDLGFGGDGNKPVTPKDIAKETLKAATKVSPERVTNFMKSAIPKSAKGDIDKLEGIATTAIDTFNSNYSELKKHADDTAKAIKSLVPGLDSIIDKIWTTEEEEKRRERESEEERLDRIANAEVIESIGDLTKVQELNNKVNNALEDKRNRSVVEVLKAINQDTAYSRLYDKEITSKFQNKLLQVQIKSLHTLADMRRDHHDFAQLSLDRLTAIVENTSMPDVMKARKLLPMLKSEFGAQVRKNLTDTMFNSDLSKRMRDKTKNVIDNAFALPKEFLEQVAGSLTQAADFKETAVEMGMDRNEIMGEMLVGEADKKLGEIVGEKLSKNKFVMSVFNKFNDFMRDPKESINKIQEKIGNDNIASRTVNNVLDNVADILNTKDSVKNVDLSRADLGTPDTLDVRTKLTINKAIPGFLAKIHAEVRANRLGDTAPDVSSHELTFDYRTYTFRGKSAKFHSIMSGMYGDVIKYKHQNRRGLESNLYKKIGIEEKDMSNEEKKRLSDYLSGRARNYGLNVANLSKTDVEELSKEIGVSEDTLHNFLAKFKDYTEDMTNRADVNEYFSFMAKRSPGMHNHINDALENGNLEELLKIGIIKMDKNGDLSINSDFENDYVFRNREGRKAFREGKDTYTSTIAKVEPRSTGWSNIVSDNGIRSDLTDLANLSKAKGKELYGRAIEEHDKLMENNKLYRSSVNTLGNFKDKGKELGSEYGDKVLGKARKYGVKGLARGRKFLKDLGKKLGKNKKLRKAQILATRGWNNVNDFVDENLADLRETEIYKDAMSGYNKGKELAGKLKDGVMDNIDPELKEAIIEQYENAKSNIEANEYVKKGKRRSKAMKRLGKRKYKEGLAKARSYKEDYNNRAIQGALGDFLRDVDAEEATLAKTKIAKTISKKGENIKEIVDTLANESKVLEAIQSARESGSEDMIDNISSAIAGTDISNSSVIKDAISTAKQQISNSKQIGQAAQKAAEADDDKWNGIFNLFRLSKVGLGMIPFKTSAKFALSTLATIIRKGHALDWKLAKGFTMGALKGGLGLAKGLGKGGMSAGAGIFGLGKGLGKAGLSLATGGKYGQGWKGDMFDGAVDLGGMLYHPLMETATGVGSGFKQGWNSKLRSPFQFMAHHYDRYKKLWNGGELTPEGTPGSLEEQGFINPDLPNQQQATTGKSLTAKLGGLYSKGKGKIKGILNVKEDEERRRAEEVQALSTMASEAMILNAGMDVQEQIMASDDSPSVKKAKGSKLYRKMRVWMKRRKKDEGGGMLGKLLPMLGGGIASFLTGGLGTLVKGLGTGIITFAFSAISGLLKTLFGGLSSMLGGAISGGAGLIGKGIAGAGKLAMSGMGMLGAAGKAVVNKLGFGGDKTPKVDPKIEKQAKVMEERKIKAEGKKAGGPNKEKTSIAQKVKKALSSNIDKVKNQITKKCGPKAGAKIAAKFAAKAAARLVPYLGWALLVADAAMIGYYMIQGHTLLGAICKSFIGFDPYKDAPEEAPVDENGNPITPDLPESEAKKYEAKTGEQSSEYKENEDKTEDSVNPQGTVSDEIKKKEREEANAQAARSATDTKMIAQTQSSSNSAFLEILKANNAIQQEQLQVLKDSNTVLNKTSDSLTQLLGITMEGVDAMKAMSTNMGKNTKPGITKVPMVGGRALFNNSNAQSPGRNYR